MGVRGLQGFVGSTCPHICTIVNIHELAERHRNKYPGCTPTIVVDAMCCLRYWYTAESWVCGGQWREYYCALRNFVAAFTSAGIKLIFFFDGMVEPGKRDEWVKRRLKNNREISKIFHYIKSKRDQPGRNMFFIPSGLAIFTRFALKTLGQETFCSLQEADYEVASYGLQHNCLGILGEDTDYLIYDTCPYFSIGDLCLESLQTIMLCREKLCESLGLRVADLPLLACLLGNDITPESMFESFRYKCLSSYASVKENAGKKGNIILAVSDYISKVLHLYQGEKKIEEMLPLGPNKALFYKGVTSYLLPGQKSPWLVQKPKGMITDKQQMVSLNPESKQEVPMCIDPEFKQEVPVCTNPESMQEVPMCMDPEPNQEASMCTDPESKQEVPMCTDSESKPEVSQYTNPESKQKLPSGIDTEFNLEALMCTHPEFKQEDVMDMEPEIKQVTMVSESEILKVARMHHVHSESYLVYNILSSGEIECSNTLEDELDQALPSQAFIYRPVRQRVYALLLGDWKDGASTGPVVKEWFVYPGNSLKHPDLVRPLQMTVQGGTPSLEVLWLSQEPAVQAQRLDTLLACFNLSSSREELQAVESPLRALCCLLIYLFVQVDTLSLEDLHAFIAQALCLQGKSTSQLMHLQLDYINSRAVQLGSLLVRGLTTLVLVNSACGFPWTTSEFMPWNVFDGKLFHQKYLQSEKGYAVEVLLEQNRSWLTKFHNLKAVVCKACSKENRRIVGRTHWDSPYTGRQGRQGYSSYRTDSTHGHSGQSWRNQGSGGRQHERNHWRRY
ncbi:constitutive coactivator of peroxisome proliferator-activated receptor gamma [Mus musculus]|uniref:Constitutive coactivator of peroxisome proliferator-activated receptor gamma n=1 Tax=Mus musculus TaxID=10090 RepID=F120B_MOUSE|nr:constitutive coactivator of peroxisome proliferator-activated receptor gamma [Mus musculus]NP_077165.2 constitutive coactivator of peroxisome proliferator-activated receptor gamma [Mus musculus]Q6RI63.1 RecName: Full=Constitutive coactivator of peroxisome proliferator-activated receptor gamma; Short=Constitutive coactivator of PPAR-gamma; Short=Constitutive coactivator of PPARG; AltName: Full=Protein FAM120B [Mus musculus]AAR30868.1 KIAA1838-like protein [Mus musculus]ABH09085.1 PPARgamma co|eukprot:NP_077165.2 constitutive coactivator of peroxisome proliferator-activated receptor gamma [Mus musculus]